MSIIDKTIFDDSKVAISERDAHILKIKEELCVNESDTEEDIIKNINFAYKQALNYLQDELFYPKSAFWKAWNYVFKSFDDVIYFLDETRSNVWQLYCRIAKLTISFYNTNPEFNTTIAEVIKKTQLVIANKMIPWLQIWEDNEYGFSWLLTLENHSWDYKVIPFRFLSRLKSQKSTVWKEIRDPKYFLLENLSDIYGWKFFLKNRDDILPFSQYIAGIVFKKGIFDIKDRWMFSDSEIEANDTINEDFREKCKDRNKDRKKISSENMRDWRLVSPYKKDDAIKNMSLEIWFWLEWWENETWLTSQYIYAFLRKIDEVIRLDQFIFPDHVKKVVQWCVKGLSNEQKEVIFKELRDDFWYIWKKIFLENNSHARANIDTYLIPAIYEYFIDKNNIFEIRGAKWKIWRIAYSNERQASIHKLEKIKENS